MLVCEPKSRAREQGRSRPVSALCAPCWAAALTERMPCESVQSRQTPPRSPLSETSLSTEAPAVSESGVIVASEVSPRSSSPRAVPCCEASAETAVLRLKCAELEKEVVTLRELLQVCKQDMAAATACLQTENGASGGNAEDQGPSTDAAASLNRLVRSADSDTVVAALNDPALEEAIASLVLPHDGEDRASVVSSVPSPRDVSPGVESPVASAVLKETRFVFPLECPSQIGVCNSTDVEFLPVSRVIAPDRSETRFIADRSEKKQILNRSTSAPLTIVEGKPGEGCQAWPGHSELSADNGGSIQSSRLSHRRTSSHGSLIGKVSSDSSCIVRPGVMARIEGISTDSMIRSPRLRDLCCVSSGSTSVPVPAVASGPYCPSLSVAAKGALQRFTSGSTSGSQGHSPIAVMPQSQISGALRQARQQRSDLTCLESSRFPSNSPRHVAACSVPTSPRASGEKPKSHAEFIHLHEAALTRMQEPRVPQDLCAAYKLFGEANLAHQALHGKPCGEAIYNMACCLSVGAATCTKIDETLPTAVSAKPEWLAEAQLDLAATTLEAAVHAGYADPANLVSDPDIKFVRDKRCAHFFAALQRARAPAGGGMPTQRSATPRSANCSSVQLLGIARISSVAAASPAYGQKPYPKFVAGVCVSSRNIVATGVLGAQPLAC